MNPLKYAYLAQSAYTFKPTIGDEDSAARAIVDHNEDGKVVSFPGTNNIDCWLADLDAETIDVLGLGTLHKGFWNAFSSIRSPLMQALPDVIVGHSEGAALAIIYGAALCSVGNPPKAIFAFAPPRVSIDDTIANLFEAHGVKLFLFRNGEDIVPCVPRLLHSWQHPADLISIGNPTLPIWNVEDHMIQKYIDALTNQSVNFQVRD